VVVPVRGIHLSTDELASYATKHLSPFKVPRRWLLLDDETLPMLPTGKVDFHAMRALFAGTAGEAAPGTR
jgi:acyl-CoA synthetase (AMP-forming)/AMP-acid ligase II